MRYVELDSGELITEEEYQKRFPEVLKEVKEDQEIKDDIYTDYINYGMANSWKSRPPEIVICDKSKHDLKVSPIDAETVKIVCDKCKHIYYINTYTKGT